MTTLNPIHAVPSVPSKSVSCHHGAKPYRPYFLAGMAVMLLAGVGWGSALLVKLAVAGKYTALSIHEINAHGHAMLSGFIQLFIIGFAYQAFPRLLGHPLFKPRWCLPVLALFLVGLGLSVAGQLLAGATVAPVLALVGDLLEIVAILIFVVQMAITFRLGQPALESHLLFILAAMLFMVVAAGVNAWLNVLTLRAESRMEVVYYVSTYQPALRYVQLHGVVLLMILGVGHRLLTNFYAFPRTSERLMRVALAILVASVVSEASLFVAFRVTDLHVLAALMLLPWLGLIAGATLVVGRWKLWRRPRDAQGQTDRMAPFVQASFAWLYVALLMTIALPFYSRAIGAYFSHGFYGGSWQAFVVGFATMMIIAFTLRVVPTLNGIVPVRLKPMRAVFWLLNAGCLLHIVVQILGEVVPAANRALPVAAGLQFVAVAWWISHMIWCMTDKQGLRDDPSPSPSHRLQLAASD